MAIIHRYVNPDSSPGGDGTTLALSGDDRAYNSLNAWDAAEAVDLVAAGDSHVVHCDTNGTPDVNVRIGSGWLTSVDNTITVQVDQANRHAGVFDESKYWIDCNSADAITISDGAGCTTLDGIQIDQYSTGFAQIAIYTSAITGAIVDSRIVIKNCIGKGSNNGSASYNSFVEQNSATLDYFDAFNNIAYGFGPPHSSATGLWNHQDCVCRWYNNTMIDCTNGLLNTGGNVTEAKNNIAQGNIYDFSGNFLVTSDYNLSEDGTAITMAGGGGNSIDYTELTFENEAGFNYLLNASDTVAIDAGEDLSGIFTTDILGNTRSGWSIGAHEYETGEPPADSIVPIIMNNNRRRRP